MDRTHPDDPMCGQLVDDQGRCEHYHGEDDIVCFRFPESGWKFWACHECYARENGAPARLWQADEAQELAIQCGVCRSILGIFYYLERQESGIHECPHCHAAWNPKCADHRKFYFDF